MHFSTKSDVMVQRKSAEYDEFFFVPFFLYLFHQKILGMSFEHAGFIPRTGAKKSAEVKEESISGVGGGNPTCMA